MSTGEYHDPRSTRTVPWPNERRPTIVVHYDSVFELLEVASRPTSPWADRRISREFQADEWSGSKTWDVAFDLARKGWIAGYDRINSYIDVNRYVDIRSTPALVHDVVGYLPDVPRFIAGDPASMIDFGEIAAGNVRTVSLWVSSACQSDVPSKDLLTWGAGLLNLIDELETRGIRTQINWFSYSECCTVPDGDRERGPNFFMSFRIKNIDQPMSVEGLAFWLMHPAAQRRLQFAVKEQFDICRWYYWKYGIPIFSLTEVRKVVSDRKAIILQIRAGMKTIEEAIDSLRNELMAQDAG